VTGDRLPRATPRCNVIDSVRQLLTLAREHYARRDANTADTLLREVVRQDDSIAEAHDLLGLVQHERGDLKGARESFAKAVALDATRAESAVNLAITCNELGLYAEARRVAAAMSTAGVASTRVDTYARQRLADLHAETAHAYAELGLHPEAIEEYRKALALNPDRVDLRTRLGVALRSDGDLAGARAELESAAASAPEYSPARVALGLTYFRLGRRDDAEAAWKKALTLDPAQRPASVYLRMLAGNASHLPSIVPSSAPPPVAGDDIDESQVSVLTERDASR
jgi:Tfp pilus assembly protein PilF